MNLKHRLRQIETDERSRHRAISLMRVTYPSCGTTVPDAEAVHPITLACERMMIQGQTQFLLCHYHPAAATQLSPNQFRSLHIGDDVLLPVSVPVSPGSHQPLFSLPGTADAPLPYLAYRPESGMGE
jgi:hypothetical protein